MERRTFFRFKYKWNAENICNFTYILCGWTNKISDLYLSLVQHMKMSFVFRFEFSLFLRFNSYLNEASCSLRNVFDFVSVCGDNWQRSKSPVAIQAFPYCHGVSMIWLRHLKWMQPIYYSHANHFQINGATKGPKFIRSAIISRKCHLWTLKQCQVAALLSWIITCWRPSISSRAFTTNA